MAVTSKPTRILIVDDDEDDFFITSDYIREIKDVPFEIEWCFRYADALQALQAARHDIYLVDYRLGAKTGLELLQEAIDAGCEEPVILLTGKGNPEVDKRAMEVGAVDYLVKPELNPEKLERSIRYAIERSQAMKALRAQEKRYRTIFEQSKDAVFIADEKLAFRDVNAAALELLGAPIEEILGNTLYAYMPLEQQRDALSALIGEVHEVDDEEIVLRTSEGETRFCILSASLITERAQPSYIQGIIHDITNIRREEKATLLAEKLASAGRLVRTLAHEVRNPLNNINLSIEQLQPNCAADDQLYLDIIHRNSRRISDLITELLNSARPSEMALTKTSLQSIVDESLSAALDRITLHKINVRIHYPDQEAFILADKEKLKIAFLNIIINAVEAMEPEKGSLYINVSANNNFFRVIIADNGSGISEEHLSRLFEPYFTSKRNGMGLGLAATLNILQSHKAEVDVKSEWGKGTSFILDFPALQ
ncbi:MAG: ATP-binding protein [Chitinophagaceae bacterium]